MTDAEFMSWLGRNWWQVAIVICLLFIAYALFQIRDEIKKGRNDKKN